MERGGTTTRRETIVGLCAAGISAAPAAEAARPLACPLRTPLDAVADRILAETPESGVFAGVPAAMDGGPLARRIDDYSPAGEERLRRALRAAGRDLAGLSCTDDADGALDLAIARSGVENALGGGDIPYGRTDPFGFTGHVPYLVNQIAGPAIDVPATMANRQSLSTPAAVDAWLAKLDAFPAAFTGVAAKLTADEAAGCRPPRVLLEGARDVIASFAAPPIERHPLLIAFHDGMATARLDARFRETAMARAMRLMERRAIPAFANLHGHITAMIPRGRDDAAPGVWAQPDGDRLYAANVRTLGDTPLSPAEVHRVGLAEVARISTRLDHSLRRYGLTSGSVGARLAALSRDPANLYSNDAAGREALLVDMRRRIAGMEARYREILPEALVPGQPLDIRAMPAATQAGAAEGYYEGPSLDGARPGIFWLNLRDTAAQPRFRLPTLGWHEGVPGHHLQASVAASLGDRPLLVRLASFNAFQEGWALYAEQLAAEMGVYARDPPGDIGRLQNELFRAARLVMDGGLHLHRWDRQHAIVWLRDTTGIASGRATAEVHRAMAWPGQALGYTLGKMRLLELRARARARRGRAFRLPAFHAAVLGHGAMPFDLLAARIG